MAEGVPAQVAILDSQAIQIALIDSQGFIRLVNEPWRRYADTNVVRPPGPGFAVSTNFLEICSSAQREDSDASTAVGDAVRRVLRREPGEVEVDYPFHSETRRRWFRTSVAPIGGFGALVMHVDITRQELAKQELLTREARNTLLLDSTIEGIYAVESKGICTFCNQTAAALLGYKSPDELVGKAFHQLHHHSHPDGRPYPISECKVVRSWRSNAGTHTDDEVYFRVNGSPFPVEYWSHPILLDSKAVGAVVTFLDTTEKRSLEAQFLHAQKLESALRPAEEIAHDFKNAMAVITGYSKLIQERLAADDGVRRYSQQIGQAAERASTLTHQLLGHRTLTLSPTLVDLNSVVTNVEKVLRQIVGPSVKVAVILDLKLKTIEADPERLEQVLINLAVNARDAMPQGGELVIQTSSRGASGYVTLSVSDSGCGMDLATQSRIFEPFFTTKPADKGTGLGLSTVQRIVKQSGGQIFLHSEPGNGTCFTIYLPVVEGKQLPLLPRNMAGKSLRGSETVLLIEDEHPLRILIADTLRSNGYTVLEAGDSASGMQLARLSDILISLVLTDAILPDLGSGLSAGELNLSLGSTAVLYMSGYTDDYITPISLADADANLRKESLNQAALLLSVRNALDDAISMSQTA